MWLETEVLSRWYWTVAKTGMVTGEWERQQVLQVIWMEQRGWEGTVTREPSRSTSGLGPVLNPL